MTHRNIQVFQVNLVSSVNKVNMTYFILIGPSCKHNMTYGASMCKIYPRASRESDSTFKWVNVTFLEH